MPKYISMNTWHQKIETYKHMAHYLFGLIMKFAFKENPYKSYLIDRFMLIIYLLKTNKVVLS